MRVGMGYDVHRLTEDRELIIGGVKIPYEKGLLGHSDADVLLHAIMDAMLGAAALGDIGSHFPDTDERFKDADSMELLRCVGDMIEEEHYIIENIDATIIAQKPKMRPNARKHSGGSRNRYHTGECQGNNRRRPWIHRERRRNIITGCLHVEFRKRTRKYAGWRQL